MYFLLSHLCLQSKYVPQLLSEQSLRLFSAHLSYSQVSHDYKNLYNDQAAVKSQTQSAISKTKRRAELLNAIPDYEVLPSQTTIKKTINMTEYDLRTKHPSELSAKERREALEYRSLGRNELLIFNLPNEQTVESVTKLVSVKGVHVQNVQIIKSIDDFRIAFARVRFASPNEATKVKKALYNSWIGDRKLKIKNKEEIGYEVYDNRTVLIKGIPNHLKEKDLCDLFGQYGAVVGVEMPLQNIAIKEHLKNKQSTFQAERAQQKELEFRRAEKLVRDSILENPDVFKDFINEQLGGETGLNLLRNYRPKSSALEEQQNQNDVLDSQRQQAISNILTYLQSESNEVSQARQVLLNLKSSILSGDASLQSGFSGFEKELESKKELVQKTVQYINKNRDEIDETTLSTINRLIQLDQTNPNKLDSLENMKSLSQQELAFAYDALIEALNQREKLITRRIKEQVNHLGIKERILFEGKDFTREFEDLRSLDPFNNEIKIEDILSVNEQINNVRNFKTMSPEEKLADIVTRTFNPFKDPNFSQEQIKHGDNPELNEFRDMPFVDPKQPQSVARLLFEGAPFQEDIQQNIDHTIQEIRGRFDMPFDELYHKERKLVDQVIKAEKALKEKQAKLPIPYGEENLYKLEDLPTEITRDPMFKREHQFVRDQRRESNHHNILITYLDEKLLKESIDQGSENTQFEHILSQPDGLEKLRDEGTISQQEYEKMIAYEREFNLRNLGYAFVTFSNTEEAKYALIMTDGLSVDNQEVETMIKGKIDHKDLDVKFTIQRQKNDALLVDEIERLREAKKELRDFERNMDQDLPKSQKLKEFREMARSVIENKMGTTRALSSEKRTLEEEELLNQQIRELQKEFPELDLTMLFETDRAEQIRRAQHKKAFASYKAFQFLKHGVEMQAKTPKQKEADEVAQPKFGSYESMDPYNFPPVQETVAQYLTKDNYIKVIDSGYKNNKPGRKFEYTHQDFLENYFGQEVSRQQQLDPSPQESVFGYNEDLKKLYPVDKHLQMPVINEKIRKLEEQIDLRAFPDKFSDDRDQNMVQFLQNFDLARQQIFEDTPHPTQEGRSLLKDTEQRLQAYFNRREKFGKKDSWNTRDVAMIKKSLREEYFPRPKKEEVVDAEKLEDTKAVEKFEPFYEGEETRGGTETHSEPATQEATSTESPIIQNTQKREGHKGKKEGTQRKNEQQDPWFVEKTNFQQDKDGLASKETQDVNKNLVYAYKHLKRQNPDFNLSDSILGQRIEKLAQDNNITTEQLLDELKDQGNFMNISNYGGEFTKKQQVGLIQDETNFQGRRRQNKSLNEFARESESEREDEDIYAHYINEMNKAKKEKAQQHKLSAQQKLAQQQLEDLQKDLPEIPNFEGFYKSLSKGQHPFEDDKYKFEDKEGEEFRIQDEQYDQELYDRELRGRLLGEKLTPRQFGVLYNAHLEDGARLKFQKDADRKQFIDNRDYVRIVDELKESFRRKKVIDGEWTEEESHEKLAQHLKQVMADMPSAKEQYKMRQQMKDMRQYLLSIKNSKTLLEKEYYFDEGLGQSVEDHIKQIKEEYPDLQILVRRDRDGFPIIKTLYKPQFKYNIDDIQNIDLNKTQNMIMESLEDLAKAIIPEAKSAETMIGKVLDDMPNLLQEQSVQRIPEFDEKTSNSIEKLLTERILGRYLNDREGFTQALLEVTKHATFDESKTAANLSLLNPTLKVDAKQILQELEQDRERITLEIMHQLALKTKDFMNFTERKDTDFVQGRRSEINLFAEQVQYNEKSAQILQKQSESMQKEQNFDKEAYQKLKEEIKRRREAKERLLQQGFPELKPYMAF